MGAAVLQRRRCRQEGLPGLLGREIRRPADHDRLEVPQRVGGVEAAERGEVLGALTLDDMIAGAWEGLSECRAVRCPACGGEMAAGGGASHAGLMRDAPHGDCVDCGAQLS
jgi:hypothetical protein